MVGLGDEAEVFSAAVLRAFDEQNTRELRREARRYAKSRVRCVRDAGQPVPRNYAIELVNDALTDTRLGIVRWNPVRCSLFAHLRGVIRARTAREVRRGRRFVYVSTHVDVSELSEEHADGHSDTVCVEHLPNRESSSAAMAGFVLRVATELKMSAHADADAQTLVNCWHAGIIGQHAVMARTGLTLAVYKATRKRVFYLSRRLSPELGESVRDMLRSGL